MRNSEFGLRIGGGRADQMTMLHFICYLLAPLIESILAILWLRRKTKQFGISELLLLPFAFIPTIWLLALAIGEINAWPAIGVIWTYQFAGGTLLWAWILPQPGQPPARWISGIFFVAGAWLNLLVMYFVFCVMVFFGLELMP